MTEYTEQVDLGVGNCLVIKRSRVAKTYRQLGLRIVEYIGNKNNLIALRWYDGDTTFDFTLMDIDWKTTNLLWRFWRKRYPYAGWDRAKPFGELSLKKAKKQYGGE